MWRLAVLVQRAAGLARADFESAWTQQLAPALQAALEPLESVRRMVLHLPPTALSQRLTAALPPQLDGMIAIWFERAEHARAAVAALADHQSLHALAAEVVAASRSVAFLARAVPPVLDGKSTVTLLAGGDVAKNMTLQEAQNYYVNVHPRVARTVPQIWKLLARYAQFTGDPSITFDVGWLARFRFLAFASNMGFASADDFIDLYNHPSYASKIRPDEEKFSDATNALTYLFEQEIVLLDRA